MGKKKGKGGGGGADGAATPREADDAAKEEAAEEGAPKEEEAAKGAADAVDVSDAPPSAPSAPAAKPEEDGEAPTMREGAVVKGRSETRQLELLKYCTVCSLPHEFCEFTPLVSKCRDNFQVAAAELYPDVVGPEQLAELMERLGMTGERDAASKKAQSGKKPSEGGAPASSKKKEAAPAQVVIDLNNRNKKKHITTVKGLEAFGVDTAAAAKLFGKRFACGAALVKGNAGQPDQIEIQGSCREKLPAVIVDKLKVSLDDIVLLYDGKKVKAADAPSEITKG